MGRHRPSVLEQLQLVFDLPTTYLGVPNGGLNGWGTMFSRMPQIVGNFLQTPTRLSRPMGKIVAQIVEGNVFNELPFALGPRWLSALGTTDESHPHSGVRSAER